MLEANRYGRLPSLLVDRSRHKPLAANRNRTGNLSSKFHLNQVLDWWNSSRFLELPAQTEFHLSFWPAAASLPVSLESRLLSNGPLMPSISSLRAPWRRQLGATVPPTSQSGGKRSNPDIRYFSDLRDTFTARAAGRRGDLPFRSESCPRLDSELGGPRPGSILAGGRFYEETTRTSSRPPHIVRRSKACGSVSDGPGQEPTNSRQVTKTSCRH